MIEFDYVINCAGLYADQIAQQFGFSKNYRILPFKGIYLYADVSAPPLRRHIYPVPNLKNPFLGVHHTISVDGHHKIGPTAIPALWREQYKGLENFKWNEFLQILGDEVRLFFSANFDFKGLATEEIKKYYRPFLVKDAASMAKEVRVSNYNHWGRPGMRAQLFDLQKKKLEMDFIVEGNQKSFHILNAVSPAFTASRPFAEQCLTRIDQLRN